MQAEEQRSRGWGEKALPHHLLKEKNIRLAKRTIFTKPHTSRASHGSLSNRGDWVHATLNLASFTAYSTQNSIIFFCLLCFFFTSSTCKWWVLPATNASADAVTRRRDTDLTVCRTESLHSPLRPEEPVWSACPWCWGASSAGWCPSKLEVCLYVIFPPLP